MVRDMTPPVSSGWGATSSSESESVSVVEAPSVFSLVGFTGGDFEVGEEESVSMSLSGPATGGGGPVSRSVAMAVVLTTSLLGFCEDRMPFSGFFRYLPVAKVGVAVKIPLEPLFIVLIER